MLNSCKKELKNKEEEVVINYSTSLPTLEKNVAAPNGVLHFKNKESLGQFMEKLRNGASPDAGSLPYNFKPLRNFLDAFKVKHPNDKDVNRGTCSFEKEQFFYDLAKYVVEDEEVEYILNDDLQVMVGDKFYQMTRIGLLVIDTPRLQRFAELYGLNEDDLYYNKNFKKFNGETLQNTTEKENTYSVESGIVRIQPIYLEQAPFFDDGPGGAGSGSGNGGANLPDPNYGGVYTEGSELIPPAEVMDTYTAGTDFDLDVSRRVGDRRFKFQVYNHNLLYLGIYKTVGIKGKLQRERNAWFITWWGESYADEIIIGVENMDLRTSNVFPSPQNYNTLPRPSFAGIGKYTLGNFDFDVVNVDVNLSANFFGRTYSLTNKTMNTLISGQLNDYRGGQFDNLFTSTVKDIAESFDAGFKQRYANYAMNVQTIDNANKLKFAIGYVRKPQGYSNINRWTFDWNTGATVLIDPQTGSVISGSPKTYSYEMKHGSFFGKARLGGYWWKYRIVVQ